MPINLDEELTLMCNPFSLLNSLWTSRQSHKIALDDVLGIGVIQPERLRPWEVVAKESIIALETIRGIVQGHGLR